MQAVPIAVRLISSDQTTPESYSTAVRGSPGANSVVLQNVEPGKYSVDLIPHGAWYVQSAQYGQTNLLHDDLVVASAGQSYPMEIVLRDDGASLTGTVQTSEGPYAEATVVVVPEPASKDYAEGIEYSNPDALQTYASQAAHVTLSPNQKTQVALDLIRTGNGD
jgi:hypothetical protein